MHGERMKHQGQRCFFPHVWRRFLPVAGFLSFCFGGALPRVAAEPANPSERVIHVVNHGRHTGVVVRRTDLLAAADAGWPSLAGEFAREEYLEFGWGSAPFYTARRITVPIALRTVFLPTPSVMHVAGFRGPPSSAFPGAPTVPLRCSESDLRAMCAVIGGTFSRDGRGRAVPVAPGLYGHSEFYRANGRYCVLDNCNGWTARVLRAGGFPVRGGGSALLAASVTAQARELVPIRVAQPMTGGSPPLKAAAAGQSGSRRSGRGRPDLRGR